MKFNIGEYLTLEYNTPSFTRVWKVVGFTFNTGYKLESIHSTGTYSHECGSIHTFSACYIDCKYILCKDVVNLMTLVI